MPTDADGAWRLSGLTPNAGTSEPYELRFRASGAGPDTASLGNADSPFTNGPQRISGITVASGGNLQGLNLPITPNGAVYNSVQRTPVAGATLTHAQRGDRCASAAAAASMTRRSRTRSRLRRASTSST